MKEETCNLLGLQVWLKASLSNVGRALGTEQDTVLPVTLLSPCPHLAELMEPLRKVGKKGSGEGELSVDVLVFTDRKKNNLDLSILLYSPKKKDKNENTELQAEREWGHI